MRPWFLHNGVMTLLKREYRMAPLVDNVLEIPCVSEIPWVSTLFSFFCPILIFLPFLPPTFLPCLSILFSFSRCLHPLISSLVEFPSASGSVSFVLGSVRTSCLTPASFGEHLVYDNPSDETI